RHKLGSNLTPVTPESFAQWKRTRMDKKLAEEEASKKAKENQNAAGKVNGMSGRDLFEYRPEWFEEEEEDDDDGDASGDDSPEWDLEKMRQETREAEEREEHERIDEMRKGFETMGVD
ncbi:hypothetical protein FS842_007944, partial [Serendipita sp. 407]